MKITLKEQECIGNSSFSGQIVYTKTFGEVFQDKTAEVILASMSLIFNLVGENVADHLQHVLTVETNTAKIRFWVIDDGSCVTFCYQKIINERNLHMDKKDYLLDLYEIELHKKSLYEDGLGTNQAKPNREKEFALAVEHIAILNELLDMLEE